LRLDVGIGRLVKLTVVGFLAESLLAGLDPLARFPLVFLAVALADNLAKAVGERAKTLYLEDFVAVAVVYSGFGLLACGVDLMLAGYTGKHSGAAIPAMLLAVVDRMWPAEGLSKKRR
jgi:hypothetical protein